MTKVREIFANTAINITSKGSLYLGAPIGISAYCETIISAKVRTSWYSELQQLTQIAQSDPHAAFVAFYLSPISFDHWKIFTNQLLPVKMHHLMTTLKLCLSFHQNGEILFLLIQPSYLRIPGIL